MASVTTGQLLYELQQVCYHSPLVDYVEEQMIDVDILKVRVHLTVARTFISVFYNLTTDKTAFALVKENRRIYGTDNAKMGWHKHPFDDPNQHVPCAPVRFETFLTRVENHFHSKS